jgi:hypothetical protein
MIGDVERTEEPQERLTRLADAAVDGINSHPENGDDVRGIIILVTDGRSGMAVFGYDEDDGGSDALTDLAANTQALFKAHGATLTFVSRADLGAGPN